MFNTVPVTAAWKTMGYWGAYLWRQHGLCPPEPGAHRACGSGAHPPSDSLLLTLMWTGKVTEGLQLWESPAGRHQVPRFQTKASCEGAVTRRCDVDEDTPVSGTGQSPETDLLVFDRRKKTQWRKGSLLN